MLNFCFRLFFLALKIFISSFFFILISFRSFKSKPFVSFFVDMQICFSTSVSSFARKELLARQLRIKSMEIFPQLSSLSLRSYRKSPPAIFDLWMCCPQGPTRAHFCLSEKLRDSFAQDHFRPLDVLPAGAHQSSLPLSRKY